MKPIHSRYYINTGFTLIELLIAMSIFATISLLSFNTLSNIQKAQTATQKTMGAIANIQRALRRFELDVTQIVERKIHLADGSVGRSFTASNLPIPTVEFTRGGADPMVNFTPSTLMRIRYQYDNNVLYRIIWPSIDQPYSNQIKRYPILKNVGSLQIIYYDASRQKHTQWPPATLQNTTADSNIAPPVAIELFIHSTEAGKFRKLILLNNIHYSRLGIK